MTQIDITPSEPTTLNISYACAQSIAPQLWKSTNSTANSPQNKNKCVYCIIFLLLINM